MAGFHRLGRAVAIFALTAVFSAGCASRGSLPDLPAATATAAALAPTPTDTADVDSALSLPCGAVTWESAGFTDADAYTDWQAGGAYTSVALASGGFTLNSPGATAGGNVLTISAAGTYVFSGENPDGAVLVDTAGDVRIVLNNAKLACGDGAPLYVKSAKSVTLSLAPGTENALTDGNTYTYPLYSQGEGEPSAALYSKADLTINGTGSLTIDGSFDDGVHCAGMLKIVEGSISVQAKDDGIVAGAIGVKAGSLTISAGGDGVKASKDGAGFVAIAGGTFHITAGSDGIAAATEVLIEDGTFEIATAQAQAPQAGAWQGGQAPGGKSPDQDGKKPAETPAADRGASKKGVKAGAFLTIAGGTLRINTTDDALHSSGSLVVVDGALTLSSGDDAIHADATAAISGGTVDVTGSYEGIEGYNVLILGGKLGIVSENDGINAAGGGKDSAGSGDEQDSFAAQGEPTLTIAGGELHINAAGDGIDTNGGGAITGGTVFISGPGDSKNSALDYDKSFTVDGGFLVALGGAGKAQAPSEGGKQVTIAGNLPQAQAAGTAVALKDAQGNIIACYTSPKAYQNVTFSSMVLERGASYTIFVDGTAVQTVTVGRTVTTFNLPPAATAANG